MAKKDVEVTEATETEALKAELAALKAELAATRQALANTAPDPVFETDPTEYVEIYVPDDVLNNRERFISLNGMNALVKPGEYVKLPKPLALLLQNSIKEEQEARKRKEKARQALQNN